MLNPTPETPAARRGVDWTADEMEFEEGRAKVPLMDGTILSVLNEDRNEVIREGRLNSPSWLLHGGPWPDARADATTFEVALMQSAENWRNRIEIEGWEHLLNDDEDDTTYGYVPASVIEAYVNKIGFKCS